jgi:hypothetical protein
MSDKTLTAEEVRRRLSELPAASEGLYYFMPDLCWMTEKTMAKALHTHARAISEAKDDLERAGLIEVRRLKNKYKRINDMHVILKVNTGHPLLIPQEYQWLLRERDFVMSPQFLETKDEDTNSQIAQENSSEFTAVTENKQIALNMERLKNYSAADLNRMAKVEQAELYMEIGFLVLPTHYPKFSSNGDALCSCRNEECMHVGKHPSVKSYKHLTPETYEKRRSHYLRRFKKDKNLNIGFKVYGYSVLDVDFRHGGAYSLEMLREESAGLDETLTVDSPNGLHLYTSTIGLNQSTGLLGVGLDIRGDRTSGFIVAPCSTHKNGKQYKWESITDLQPIPSEWFCESEEAEESGATDKSITPKKKRGRTGRSLQHILIPQQFEEGYSIPEHQRNDTLFKFASRERGRGAGEEHIYDVLVTLRDTYCEESKNPKDAVTDNELRRIAKQAARYPTNAEKPKPVKAT